MTKKANIQLLVMKYKDARYAPEYKYASFSRDPAANRNTPYGGFHRCFDDTYYGHKMPKCTGRDERPSTIGIIETEVKRVTERPGSMDDYCHWVNLGLFPMEIFC